MADHLAISSTQVAHPWRATVRTVFAAVFAILPFLPSIVDALGVGSVPWVVGALAVTGGITRVLALPAVVAWTARFLPWLAPAGAYDAATSAR